MHEVVVQEVLHVSEYSYMRVLENGVEHWLAAPTTPVKVGETYYYDKFMEMNGFESKELNKTFETIYFLEGISKTPDAVNTPLTTNIQQTNQEAVKPVLEKAEVAVEAASNGISLAELFKDREKYNNKTVRIKGKVVKYNPAIMNVNWLHIQDGTDFNGEFDLTVTTKAEVNVNDIVIIEGTVALNKDFGAGYTYAIIVENASITNE